MKFGPPKVIFEDYIFVIFGLSHTHIIFGMRKPYHLSKSKKELLGIPSPKNNVEVKVS